jgi:hypothetical protein
MIPNFSALDITFTITIRNNVNYKINNVQDILQNLYLYNKPSLSPCIFYLNCIK